MATYKEIHGVNIQYRESDATAVEGDVWYNASTAQLKMYASVGAWATKANLNTAKNVRQTFGTTTAAVATGGNSPHVALTEEFDGSSWTEVTDYPAIQSCGRGVGTLTAGLVFGGDGGPPSPPYSTLCNEYDGTNWTSGGALNTGRTGMGNAGVQTAALSAGGGTYPTVQAVVEEYNGSSWSEVTDIPGAKKEIAGMGTQTSAIIAGGNPGHITTAFTYDGTNWSSAPALNTGRAAAGGGGESNTAGLVFGGSTPGNTAITEQFDGSSWTEVGDLSTPRYGIGGLAQNPSNAQLAIAGGHGGAEPNYSNQTEEWAAVASVETISFD